MTVIKRDGRKVDFQPEKIINAIRKAFEEVDGEITPYAKRKSVEIASYVESLDTDFTVEEIQDIVEAKLMKSTRPDVAKAYVIYRNDRNRIREANTKVMKDVISKLQASDVQNQNANVDEKSFGGRMGEANEAVTKNYALNYIVSEMAKNNHNNNEVYIHDLGHYAVGDHNCLSIPFDDLLANGFNTRQTDVRPANSINTAFQLVAVIFQLQSLQQFGGVSATHLDWTMIPYVRKSFSKHFKNGIKYILKDEEYSKNVPSELPFDDKEANDKYNKAAYEYAMDMTVKETQQAVEGMFHNLRY